MKKILTLTLAFILVACSSLVVFAQPEPAQASFVFNEGNGSKSIQISAPFAEDVLTQEEKDSLFAYYTIYDASGNEVSSGSSPAFMEHDIAYIMEGITNSGTYTIQTTIEKLDKQWKILESTPYGQPLTLDVIIDPTPVSYDSVEISPSNNSDMGEDMAVIKGSFYDNANYLCIINSNEMVGYTLHSQAYKDKNTLEVYLVPDSPVHTMILQRFYNLEISSPTRAKVTMTLPQTLSGISDGKVPAEPVQNNSTATPNASKVLVNSVPTQFDSYSINNNNYFKLRDLAYVLNGTNKQFEITWDQEKNAINMISGKPYTVVGGEMALGDGTAKEAKITNSAIYVDGIEKPLTAYNMGGNNYFKLRDVMQVFDVGVGWDGNSNTITIDTSVGYENAKGDITTANRQLFFSHRTQEAFAPISGFSIYSDMSGETGTLTDVTNFSFTRNGQSVMDLNDLDNIETTNSHSSGGTDFTFRFKTVFEEPGRYVLKFAFKGESLVCEHDVK